MEDDLLKGFMIMKALHLCTSVLSGCFPSLLNCPLVVGGGTCQSQFRSSILLWRIEKAMSRLYMALRRTTAASTMPHMTLKAHRGPRRV